MFTTRHTTSQHIGSRNHQVDATAHRDDPDTGHRAWVLLDGIGDRVHTAAWVRTAAPALAQLAARLGDPRAAIQQIRPVFHTERATLDYPADWPPDAAAIVAVLDPVGVLHLAWAGDCRAYLAENGRARLLTTDHNEATRQRREGREPESDAHDHLTSSLCFLTGVVEAGGVQFSPSARPRRLVLASDGAYLPHEDTGALPPPSADGSHRHRSGPDLLAPVLDGTPETVARRLTDLTRADNATALVIDLHYNG
ncbi:hypothetical protein ACIBCA_11470 [Kitasatospora sp. NPDC051170]|uniref:hypothetical protein n=1 Tax=Kitasatospora sp. NPDC051170 TaxID=3364056 RepID=UPI0037A0F8D8